MGIGRSTAQCAGMSLDEDDRLRSVAEVERFLRSVALGADYLTGVRWRGRMPRGDV